MLLVFDIGNSNIVLGTYEGKRLMKHWRISTDRQKTGDEYGMLINDLFRFQGIRMTDIDAIIIQDIGLASLIKKAIPDLPLHASTQMSVHTEYGAKALYEMGFKRVVLARELSLDEIERIHLACPEIELEVFVHGALCMCMS